MKFKYCFALMVALIVLISLTCVVASENTTDISSVQDDDSHRVGAGSDVDLSVKIEVKHSMVDGKYNQVGSEVQWTITVEAKGGIARNTQVREVLSPNLGYVSHNATRGEYDSSSGIWKVGDLTGSSSASLTIVTKLNRAGTYLNKVYATTDSNDKDLLNNFQFLSIKTDSSKTTSNFTETTDERAGSSHNIKYGSMLKNRIKDYGDHSDDKSDEVKHEENHHDEDKPKNHDAEYEYSVIKSQSFIQKVIDSNSSTVLKSISSNMHISGILPHDYMRFPILIFSLFLIVLTVIVGREKIKSKF